MPYGRPYPRGRTGTARAPRRRRNVAPPRYRRYRRNRPLPAKTLAARAYKLAKLNNNLARGSFQMNLLHSRAGINFTQSSPLCFHLVAPVNSEKIYKFRVAGGVYGPQPDDAFLHPSTAQLTGGGGLPGFTGLEQHNMWAQANDDAIQNKYKLLSQTITFQLTGTASTACKVGIFFVKYNPRRLFRTLTNSTSSDGLNFMLPDAIGSFNGLLSTNNAINGMYFTQTRKPIYMRLAPGSLLSTQEVRKTIKITHNKVFNIHPIVASGMTPPSAPYQQIALTNQEWVVICTDCDDSVAAANQPVLTMRRICRWRDLEGAAA